MDEQQATATRTQPTISESGHVVPARSMPEWMESLHAESPDTIVDRPHH